MVAGVDVAVLVSLWHGDDSRGDMGYWHEELAVEVCERTLPSNDAVLIRRFYPNAIQQQNGVDWEDIPEDAKLMLQRAYHIWKHHRILRNKSRVKVEAVASGQPQA